MGNNTVILRKIKDRAFKVSIIFFALVSTFPLILILLYIFKTGIHVINWDFFVHLPKPVGETDGGISNALIGTLILIILSCIFSLPIGIGGGIYLSETKDSKFSQWVRLSMDILQSTPSIVIGIIAYIWVVIPIGGFSAISGGIALGIMMLPIIVRSSEESLRLVPYSLKEASLALGVPYYKTILKVILPSALSGIVTGILISVARIAGETAPLLFTAFGSSFMSTHLAKPINALPLLIFNYSISPYEEWHTLAWGAALVLIMFVLLLNLLTRLVTRRWKVQF